MAVGERSFGSSQPKVQRRGHQEQRAVWHGGHGLGFSQAAETQCRSAQHAAGADQRQPDQRGGVVVVDALEQGNAQTFAFGAARAVVGLFGPQVGLDFGVAAGRGTSP